MAKKIEAYLIEHNGATGRSPVLPFAGAIIPLPAEPYGPIEYEGRRFTYAHSVEFDTNGYHLYREQKTGKPSQWALLRQAEQAAA